MTKLFISYSSKNRATINTLVELLKNATYEVWYDQQIRSGNWWDIICEHIRACDIFVYAVTSEYIDSYPCDLEYRYALALNRQLCAVRLTEINFSRVQSRIALAQVIDLSNIDSANAFEKLLSALDDISKNLQPLPNPLPTEPAAPISKLTEVIDEVTNYSNFLNNEKQIQILNIIRPYLQQPDSIENARYALTRFQDRKKPDRQRDLYAHIDEEIQIMLGSSTTARPLSPISDIYEATNKVDAKYKLTPEAIDWAKRLAYYWLEGKIEQSFVITEIYHMGNTREIMYGHGILDDETRKSADKPSVAILKELASKELILISQSGFSSTMPSWDITLTQNLKLAVASGFVAAGFSSTVKQQVSDYTDDHRAADLRLLKKIWRYINSPRVQRIIDEVKGAMMKYENYRNYIDEYIGIRTLPENHFVIDVLEQSFLSFDRILNLFCDQLGLIGNIEEKGETEYWIPHYRINERDYPDRYEIIQIKREEFNELVHKGENVLNAHAKLIRTIKLSLPEFQFETH